MLSVTVSQLNRYVRLTLEHDPKLRDIYVRGEISNLSAHYASGHLYFSLKDAGGSVKAVMFADDARQLRFRPENGMAVLAQSRVGVFERDGVYQIYVRDLQPDGAGALMVFAHEQFFDEAARDGHAKGWNELFAQMENLLA